MSDPKITIRQDLWTRLPRPLAVPGALAVGTLLTAAAAGTATLIAGVVSTQTLPLVFLLAILLGAVAYGVPTGMTAAVLSFLAYNFFFIEPLYTFTIADPRELFALLAFFGVALITGSLAGRLRAVADDSRMRANSLQSLNAFAAVLSAAMTENEVLQALVLQAAKGSVINAMVLLKSGDELRVACQSDDRAALGTDDLQSAWRALRGGAPVFPPAAGWPGGKYEFYPMTSTRGDIGALGILRVHGCEPASEDVEALETVLHHAGIAFDRLRLQAEAAFVRDEAERERLRSALLSSLSHDLKTPLASIVGAVSSLRELGPRLDEATRADLLTAIEEETQHLSHFVGNLLDMTRLEADPSSLLRDWFDAGDAVRAAVDRATKMLAGVRLTLRVPPSLPPLKGDAVLFEHVLFNLLDNAAKYAEGPAEIDVDVSVSGNVIRIAVTDAGRGIPANDLPHVFDRFYRGKGGDRAVPGTGLGLTLSKRIVEAMSGTIAALSPAPSGRGTEILITMPVPVGRESSDRSGGVP